MFNEEGLIGFKSGHLPPPSGPTPMPLAINNGWSNLVTTFAEFYCETMWLGPL